MEPYGQREGRECDAWAVPLSRDHASLSRQSVQTIYLTITPYRDTTLLQVRGFAPAGSNALTLVRMSISVLKDHFDAIAKTHRGDKVRADDAMPAEQKTMAIAVAEGIPCSVIEVVDPPTVLVE